MKTDKIYKRTLMSIKYDDKTRQSSEYNTYFVQTEKGKTQMRISRKTPVPKVGQTIYFKVKNYYKSDKFFISELITK